jgi:HPt (histidine-containing phosphotransfer) domain-containing protein
VAPEEDGVNEEVFGGLLELGREVVVDLITSYIEDSARLARDLSAGLGARDASACARAAHDLKSTSAALGADAAARVAGDVELAARRGDLASLPPLVGAVAPALERAHAALRARVAT